MRYLATILLLLCALGARGQVFKLPVVTMNRTEATNGTQVVGFAWELSPSSGVVKQILRFGAASNALDRQVELGATNQTALVWVSALPVHARVFAVDADGNEAGSNLAGDLGRQTVVTNIAQASADLVSWRDIGVINVESNASFTRIRQVRTERRLTYP